MLMQCSAPSDQAVCSSAARGDYQAGPWCQGGEVCDFSLSHRVPWWAWSARRVSPGDAGGAVHVTCGAVVRWSVRVWGLVWCRCLEGVSLFSGAGV